MSVTVEIHSSLAELADRDKTAWKGAPDELGLAVPPELSEPPIPSAKGELNRQIDSFLGNLFRRTQRVDGEDINRLTSAGYELPSLSVGDIIIIDNGKGLRVAYAVKVVGFQEVGRVIDGAIAR